MDAFESRASFEVGPVVGDAVEGDEVPPRLLRGAQQEVVEDLTPCPGMQGSAVRKDSLEVEDASVHGLGEAEHGVPYGNRRQPWLRLRPGDARHVLEQTGSLLALPHELLPPLPQIGVRHRSGRGPQGFVRGIERPLPAGAERLELRAAPRCLYGVRRRPDPALAASLSSSDPAVKTEGERAGPTWSSHAESTSSGRFASAIARALRAVGYRRQERPATALAQEARGPSVGSHVCRHSGRDELGELHETVRVAPLVVVPRDDFDLGLVDDGRQRRVEDRRVR